MFVLDPVISLAIKPIGTETPNFSCAPNCFQKEDPTFRIHVDHESKEARLLSQAQFHLELTTPADDHLRHGQATP
jgi:elongation factor G